MARQTKEIVSALALLLLSGSLAAAVVEHHAERVTPPYHSIAVSLNRRAPEQRPAAKTPIRIASRALSATPDSVMKAGAASAALTLKSRFVVQIWPILKAADHNCVGCHGASNPSSLHFTSSAADNYQSLLDHGYLSPTNPTGILTRVSAKSKDLLMPPAPEKPLSAAEIRTIQTFENDLEAVRKASGGASMDERFPAALLTPYHGKRYSGGPDNTFLTYFQLKGKIQSIFGDNWQRNGDDLFERYIDLFGGADFHLRFHESSQPTAEYLAGVDLLSRDVASRSYLTASGPFAGWPEAVPAPRSAQPSTLYRHLISQLFERVVFRPPSDSEIQSSYRLMQGIYKAAPKLAARPDSLNFTLTVTDPNGLATSQNFTIPVSTEPYGEYQQYVDETAVPAGSNSPILSASLTEPLLLKKDDAGQQLLINNGDTDGDVSIAGVTLTGPLPSQAKRQILVSDPSVTLDGAWEQKMAGKTVCYDDAGQNKGSSTVTFPLSVPATGRYRVSLEWRKGNAADNASAVLVQVLAHSPTHLAMKTVPALPPPGEARFIVDETVDNVAFHDLKTRFRFAGPGDGVEISNAGTRRRVVADAVRLVPDKGDPLVLTGNKADGHEKWEVFKAGEFGAYNTTGPVLYDDGNKDKGKLSLLYRPATLTAGFNPADYYRVEVGVPGHVDNETAAPVIVHASASSPIVQVSYPVQAHVGATVYLDASRSYNLQRTPLHYTWSQTGGPRARLIGDMHGSRVQFQAPALQPQQAAWEGLCAALIRSPDFLFSRPVSLAVEKNPAIRRRLQLVKIAQDLVARTPSPEELKELAQGASLHSFVDKYLASQEFRTFYMRRIRLYLESHGSVVDDEPVRLWCYIAFHNLPFQQILTADYTVNPQFQKESRPAYYGHTGLLLMKGFVQGKPSLPHFNYAAQVCEKFLGKVFEVPPDIVKMRVGSTAASTTNPNTVCYSCHKLLTPLAFQRSAWNDNGDYVPKDKSGELVDDTDHDLVPSYPFRGKGMSAFALGVQHKEAFIRTIIQTHFNFFFGRAMRCDEDERGMYYQLWKEVHHDHFALLPLIRTLVTSPEYLNGPSSAAPLGPGGVDRAPKPPGTREARRLNRGGTGLTFPAARRKETARRRKLARTAGAAVRRQT
ncbi:MAG TPA: hypothetical protein VFJ58_25705 [Armatimonadota bacterium]|nr:hypothetical protein [Armatimonadota bacterium]